MNDENQINSEFNEQHIHQKKQWFWKDGLSIDETKLSTLIICLLFSMLFGCANYIIHGDITNNLSSIIQALIYAIAGVNIGNGILNKIGGMTYSGFNGGMNQSNYQGMNGMSQMSQMSQINNINNIKEIQTQAPISTSPVIPPGVTTMPTGNNSTNKIPDSK